MCVLPNQEAGDKLAAAMGYRTFVNDSGDALVISMPLDPKDTSQYPVHSVYSRLLLSGSNPVVAESTCVWVNESLRGKGLGNRFMRDRLMIYKAYGLQYVWCSVNKTNEPQRRVMRRNGWYSYSTLPTQILYGKTL